MSTYCFVATCKANTGSCVTATEVKPPSVRLEAPRAIDVVPTVTDEFVRLALAMLVSVFVAPLIDLLVKVSVVARPTKVSVAVGRVTTPVLLICEITGSVSVLLVRVWVAVRVTTSTPPTVTAVALNVPPVTVFPVKVNAVGNETTTLVVPVAVISFAVPDTDATAPIPAGVTVTFAAAVSWPCALTVNVPTCVVDP